MGTEIEAAPVPRRSVPGPRPKRPPAGRARRGALRAVSVVAGGALLATAVFAGAQGVVSTAAARIASSALERELGGHVAVSVSAMPAWMLTQGRFQYLSVEGKGLRSGDLRIARLVAHWRNGRVSLAALRRGAPIGAWLTGGRLAVRLWLAPAALLAVIPQSPALRVTSLRLAPPGVWVDGRIRIGELTLPFRALGSPQVVDNGQVLVFRVTKLHAGPIVLRYALGIPVVDLSHTPLHPVLAIDGASVGAKAVQVELVNRAAR